MHTIKCSYFYNTKFNKKEIKAEDFTNIETDYILEDFKSYLENFDIRLGKLFIKIKNNDYAKLLVLNSDNAWMKIQKYSRNVQQWIELLGNYDWNHC